MVQRDKQLGISGARQRWACHQSQRFVVLFDDKRVVEPSRPESLKHRSGEFSIIGVLGDAPRARRTGPDSVMTNIKRNPEVLPVA
jgi:hypothetical protein